MKHNVQPCRYRYSSQKRAPVGESCSVSVPILNAQSWTRQEVDAFPGDKTISENKVRSPYLKTQSKQKKEIPSRVYERLGVLTGFDKSINSARGPAAPGRMSLIAGFANSASSDASNTSPSRNAYSASRKDFEIFVGFCYVFRS